ncbi:MAG TPA: hypothetical protein VHV10_20340, partial [Ktedonobacteraceae bacterium]|nr:hypothetical protein [Ktedonobacteraceae bacterium]
MSNEETSAELRKLTVRGLNPETLATLKVLAARAGQPLEAFVRETLEAIAVQPVAMQHYVLRAWSTSPALVGVVIRRAEEGAYPGATPGLSQEQKAAYDAAVECIERNDPGDREKAIGLLAQQFEDCYEQPLAKEQRYSIKFG